MEALTQGSTGMVFAVAVFVILAVALYYLYSWLNGSGEMVDVAIYSDETAGLVAKSIDGPTVFDKGDVPALYGGGEFSVCTWIYITNWGVNRGNNKIFLKLSGGGPSEGGYQTMVMYLGQRLNKLGIRVSYDSSVSVGSSNILNAAQMNLIETGTSPYTDTSGDFKKCDIESVDLQRWVCITAVLTGRTLDVYMDGKLSRSCVLDGMFKVDGTNPTLKLGGDKGFGGYIGMTRAANFAYSPDQVYKHYQNGPLSPSLGKFISALTSPGTLGFDITKNGKSIFNRDGKTTFFGY